MPTKKLYKSNLLKNAANRSGVSLRDIQAETGIDKNTVAKIYSGSPNVNLQKLKRLSDFLKVELKSLFN